MFNLFRRRPKEQTKLFYNTDMHCHILPYVDHGAQTIDDSLAMLRAEIDMGISRVVCTSHVTAETFENTPETLSAAFEKLKAAVKEEGLPVELMLSAEYRIDEYWNKEYAAGHVLPMPGKYLLLENSFIQELIGIDELMFELQVKGYRTILAHPERYRYYHGRHERYEKLHSMGVIFQLNILSLAGYFGSAPRTEALWLIEHDMCSMLGSDMHNLDHADIIKDYINSREWHKLIEKHQLERRIINDFIEDTKSK